MNSQPEQFGGFDPVTVRGGDWRQMSIRKRAALLDAAFVYWRRSGFPYYRLSPEQLVTEFQGLRNQNSKSAWGLDGALGSCVGLRVANNFQPGMWSVRVSRYRCPMQVFEDDELLRKAIERAWTIWPDRFGANPSNLRRMLKTFTHTAAVSNFRPTLARAVIDRYSQAGNTVLDFSDRKSVV